jgi:hypothetical protein
MIVPLPQSRHLVRVVVVSLSDRESIRIYLRTQFLLQSCAQLFYFFFATPECCQVHSFGPLELLSVPFELLLKMLKFQKFSFRARDPLAAVDQAMAAPTRPGLLNQIQFAAPLLALRTVENRPPQTWFRLHPAIAKDARLHQASVLWSVRRHPGQLDHRIIIADPIDVGVPQTEVRDSPDDQINPTGLALLAR